MAQQKIPDVATPYTTVYSNLLGVDFRADQTEVERRRSPDMVNMISDVGGNPIKRDGYRRIGTAYDGIVPINGDPWAVRVDNSGVVCVPIYIDSQSHRNIVENTVCAITIPTSAGYGNIVDVLSYKNYIIIIFDNGIARVNADNWYAARNVDWTEAVELCGCADSMMSKGSVGSSAPVCEAVVPQSVIGLSPDGTGASASVLYGKNLFSIYQQYLYAGDGTSTVYKIPFYSKMGAWAKVEVMDSNGDWQTQVEGTDYTLGTASTVTAVSLNGASTASFSVVDAEITFTTAPSSPTQTLAGEDNVRITVAPFNDKTEDMIEISGTSYPKGYFNENLTGLFGNSNPAYIIFEGRLFMAAKERTYYSEVGTPFMIPDNNWFDVDSTVMAYQTMSSNLVIITVESGKHTIFLASAITDTTLGTDVTAYAVKTSNSGVGAVTPFVGGILNDEPIFLSLTGIYGLLTNWSSEKYAVNRSGRINRRLCKEEGLWNAVGCSFGGYYYLAINSHMYVLDGRHKDNTRSGETSYECYYFTYMPNIVRMFGLYERLLFTDGVYTYTFNTDLPDTLRYYDDLVLDNDGEYSSGSPVSAYWKSVFDDDGAPQILKTLKKKGTMAVLTPYAHTGCYVTLIKDGDEYQELGYQNTTIFSFADVNFGYDDDNNPQFTFNSNEVAYDRFTKKKIKKYKRLQIIVGNDYAEPFALTKVVKTYERGNYAKR